MTKIAHVNREHDQDAANAERNDQKLTRVARPTATAGPDFARQSAQVAQRTVEAGEALAETTRQFAKEAPEVGHTFAELLQEQTRQSADTVSAFARAVNWTEVTQAQSKLIAGSLLRISQFNAAYGQFLLRGMTATATSTRR